MNRVTRSALTVVAVIIVAVAGYSLLSKPSTVDGPAGPSPSARALSAGGNPLEPGRYALVWFPVGVTFEVPAGWSECTLDTLEQSVCNQPSETYAPTAVGFSIVVNVVKDPCGRRDDLLDPPPGPSVDDLVAAISGLAGFDATAPVGITVDGFRGKELTVTAPPDPACGFTWATPRRTNGVGPGEVNVMRIVDVDGTRVVVAGAYHPEDPAHAENLAAIQHIMGSVHFIP